MGNAQLRLHQQQNNAGRGIVDFQGSEGKTGWFCGDEKSLEAGTPPRSPPARIISLEKRKWTDVLIVLDKSEYKKGCRLNQAEVERRRRRTRCGAPDSVIVSNCSSSHLRLLLVSAEHSEGNVDGCRGDKSAPRLGKNLNPLFASLWITCGHAAVFEDTFQSKLTAGSYST